jgi:hypothetical protein
MRWWGDGSENGERGCRQKKKKRERERNKKAKRMKDKLFV